MYSNRHDDRLGRHRTACDGAETTNAQREITRGFDSPHPVVINNARCKHVVSLRYLYLNRIVSDRRRNRLCEQAGCGIKRPPLAGFPRQDRQHRAETHVVLPARESSLQLCRHHKLKRHLDLDGGTRIQATGNVDTHDGGFDDVEGHRAAFKRHVREFHNDTAL